MRKLASLICVAAVLCCGRAYAAAGDMDDDGVPDEDEVGNFDGDALDDALDPDDDNDTIPTATERARGDSDGDMWPDYLDVDDDNDGVPTAAELGDGGAPRDTDQDGKLDYLDADDDNDGEPTATERQSAPPEPDANQNGVPDYLDPAAFGSQAGAIPNEGAEECAVPSLTPAGLPVCLDQDHDGDGIWSRFEGAPDFKLDSDGDGVPDFRDADDDDDGVPTADESPDPNHDGNPDDARATVGNSVDYLERDDDDDGIPTKEERPDGKDRDTDLDGRPNHLDNNDDGDALSTNVEVSGPEGVATDSNMNGVPAYLDAQEQYQPESVRAPGGAFADAGVIAVIGSDGGVAATSPDAGRRDAGASPTSDAAQSEPGDESEGSDGTTSDIPPSSKDSGCSVAKSSHDDGVSRSVALGVFALLTQLLARRRMQKR